MRKYIYIEYHERKIKTLTEELENIILKIQQKMLISDSDKIKNFRYEMRITNVHQGLIVNGHITRIREITEYTATVDFETSTYFYQNPLNRQLVQTPDTEMRIINLFEVPEENTDIRAL